MSALRIKKPLVVLVLLLVSLSCNFPFFFHGIEIHEDTTMEDINEEIARRTEEAKIPHTPQPIEIQPIEKPLVKGCYWRNYEILPAVNTTSNPHMQIDTTDVRDSISTKLSHGVSGCSPQHFYTYHYWDFPKTLIPGQTEKLGINLSWSNFGTPDCTSLIAGATTALEVADVRLKAENLSINVKTEPEGSISDSSSWLIPDGIAGEKITITVRAITGSYGGVVRYRYEFTCD